LLDAHATGRLPRRELEASVERVRGLRARRAARAAGGPPAPEVDGGALAMAMATRAATEFGARPPGWRRALNGRVGVIVPRFSELAPRITIEEVLQREAAWIERAFAPLGIAAEPLVVGVEPSDAEIADAAARAAVADATVLFLFDAHLYPSNRALLEAVQRRARALAVVLLRDPWDATLLAPGVLGLTAYGFRDCQLRAVVARLG
jgi:hypothetical protein